MPFGIAILGAGFFAKEAHLPALATLGNAAPILKAVYSRSQKSAQDLATLAVLTLGLGSPPDVYHDDDGSKDLDALLARADISAVIVVLPITAQPRVILKALAAGMHVLSEKPVAPDVVEGLELIKRYNSEYKAKGLVWRVAENYEAEPGIRRVKEAIAAGKIGRVLFFNATAYNYIDQSSITSWRQFPDYQGGFVLDGGVHTIAALRVVLPHPLTHISGFASLKKDYLAPHDTINVVARSDPGSNLHGTVVITFAAPTEARPQTDEFLITGTNGWISVNEVDSGSRTQIVVKYVFRADGKPDEKREEVVEEMRGVEIELANFFDLIAGRGDNIMDLGDPLGALWDVAFIQAALNSHGNLIDISDFSISL